jgi:hypothetical protein
MPEHLRPFCKPFPNGQHWLDYTPTYIDTSIIAPYVGHSYNFIGDEEIDVKQEVK